MVLHNGGATINTIKPYVRKLVTHCHHEIIMVSFTTLISVTDFVAVFIVAGTSVHSLSLSQPFVNSPGD